MAIPSDVQDALDRLNGGYNNGDYNASTNPLGFSNGGHRENLYALTADVTLVGVWLNDQVAPVVDISDEIEALAAVVTQIEQLSAIDDQIVQVAAIRTQVTAVAAIAANVTTVAGIAANVNAVADIAANVTTVAGIHAQVTTVAARDAAIATVAARDTAIGQVAAIDDEVATVAGVASAVTTVAGIDEDVSAVATIGAAVSTVAARDAAIATVAARDADIVTLAARDADIATVADRDADIGTVATISTQVAAVAAIDDDIVTVAGINTQVSTVAARDAAIGIVAARDTAIGIVAAADEDIATVASIAGAVSTVAGIDEDVSTVAGISGYVFLAANNETDITTVAVNIADVNTVAANIGSILAAPDYAAAAQAAARPYTFDDATADANPGAGLLRLNNAAVASVTVLYVSTSDAASADQAAFLEAMDDSTTTTDRGQIILSNPADRSNQAAFRVTGAVTTATGYRKVPVAYLGHSGSFTDGDVLALGFNRTGDKGVDGLGAGDVLGPAGATDENLVVFDGATGKAVADGGVSLSSLVAALAKVAYLTVTQGVDLDAIETRVNALDAAVVLKGTFSASGGSFPGGGTAQMGESWIASSTGTIDGAAITTGDRVIAIADNASTSIFAGNWFLADYTDKVSSVNGTVGSVMIEAIIHAATGKSTPVDADELGLVDSAASNALKKLTWANLKATLIGTGMEWTAGQRSTVKTVTISSGEVAWNLADGNVHLLNGAGSNFLLKLPADIATHVGQTGVFVVKQNGTGGYDMTVASGITPLNSNVLFDIAQGANAITVIPYIVISATQIGISGSGFGVAL